MPAFPSGWQNIWVAPFHTAGVENADRYLSVYPIRSDDPHQRPRWYGTDLLTLQNQVTGSLEITDTTSSAKDCNTKEAEINVLLLDVRPVPNGAKWVLL